MDNSISLLREALASRLEDDYFRDFNMGERPASVREFIECLTVGNVAMRHFRLDDKARFPDLTDLNVSFSDFLARPIQFVNEKRNVIAMFREEFIIPVAVGLINEVANEGPETAVAQAALAEMQATTWRAWAQALVEPFARETVASHLCSYVQAVLADRTLMSFFVRPFVPGKFISWGPRASSGFGRPLPTRAIDGDGYSVTVSVSRYEEMDGPVTAYEWLATMTMTGATEPDAAACGMAYVFEREGGKAVGDLNDLVLVSDSMADTDVVQVKAFITQHDDAADVIEKSDLCFVWLWERRGGSTKGLGATCLTPALQDLRRRFKKMRTVVFDARPAQFATWTSKMEPPMVAVEKQTAVENLVSYIQSLKLEYDVRAIFARSADPQREALLAIGQVWMQGQGGGNEENEEDDQDEGYSIDMGRWHDAIAGLFYTAGLDDLANEVESGTAASEEVETALRHLIFDPHVQYLRATVAGNFEPLMLGFDTIEHEEAHLHIEGFDEFCGHLPEHMSISSVDRMHGYIICTVKADTPFGQFIEYFTMVPKPRPINIDSFFRNLGST